jgi:hypothetical protein
MPLKDQTNISSTFAAQARISQETRIKLLPEGQDRAGILQTKSRVDQTIQHRVEELRQSRTARINQETSSRITKLNLDYKRDGPGRPMTNADYGRIKADVTKSTRVSDARAIKQLRKESRDQIEIPLQAAERKQAQRQARVQAIMDRLGDNSRQQARNHKRS